MISVRQRPSHSFHDHDAFLLFRFCNRPDPAYFPFFFATIFIVLGYVGRQHAHTIVKHFTFL